jgi:hypothetical protein
LLDCKFTTAGNISRAAGKNDDMLTFTRNAIAEGKSLQLLPLFQQILGARTLPDHEWCTSHGEQQHALQALLGKSIIMAHQCIAGLPEGGRLEGFGCTRLSLDGLDALGIGSGIGTGVVSLGAKSCATAALGTAAKGTGIRATWLARMTPAAC